MTRSFSHENFYLCKINCDKYFIFPFQLQHFGPLCAKSVKTSFSPHLTAAYFYADKIWTRELMTKMSWGGGSKNRGVSKGALKELHYLNQFFYDLLKMHAPDCTTTQVSEFLKQKIIQHATRRANSIGSRESRPKFRVSHTKVARTS